MSWWPPDVDEAWPEAWGAQGPCDARSVRATTRTAPSCVRAGLSYLLAMAAASLSCPRWRPRPCHSRRPSPFAWDPIIEQFKLDWSTLLW